jgi:hypothetical protein
MTLSISAITGIAGIRRERLERLWRKKTTATLSRPLAVYGQMVSLPTDKTAKENLSACLTEQFNGGEQDQQRLTVLGLTYLRGVDRGL